MRKMQSRRGMAAVQTDGGVERRIHIIRGERVMLDADLATLYAVETGYLNLAVRRNRTRFPADFMFQLSTAEFQTMRSQAVISNAGRGGRRTAPYAFTEQGVAMLSSVLHSQRAIAANILIMRTFAQLRRAQGQYAELRQQLVELAQKVEGHDELLDGILRALEALAQPSPSQSRPIGFRAASADPRDSAARP